MKFGTDHLAALEAMAKRQCQVCNDYSNFGVIATDEVKDEIREACRGLAKIYVSEKNISNSYPDGILTMWSTFIPLARDHQYNAVAGAKVEVVLVETMIPRYPAYFTILIKNESQPASKTFFKESNLNLPI